ncbi:MAG: hypothetical protein GDA67_12785 [Nitrospira sp. CR1.3]|nr:hypothetical protein [Nitrospira sp. CR1.3]
MKWPVVSLGEISEITGGSTPRRDNAGYWGGEIPWVTPTDLPMPGEGIAEIDRTAERITVEGLSKSSAQILPAGTVLFSSRATIGKLGIAHVPLSTNQGFANFIPKSCVNSRYLAYALQYHTPEIALLAGTTTFREVTKTALKKFRVPLPPLSEQRRIVEILDQADAIRKQRAEADAKADRILPALFHKMFSDPAKYNTQWEQTTLGEFSLEFRYGTSTKCGIERVGLPVLRIPNVIGGEIDLSDLKYADLPNDEADRLSLEPGDILFVRTNGNPAYVGRCAIFDLAERYVFASYLIRARIDLKRADPCFVTEYLRTSEGRRAMAPYIRTTAGQSNISVEGLKQIPVLLPPLALQKQFGEFVATIRESRQKWERARSGIRNFFDSMLHHAYSGNLTAKWRESHMQELLAEMEGQAKALASRSNENVSAVVKANRHAGYDMYNKAALAAYIVHRCHEESQPLGRVKLAKLYYLAQSKAKIELTETFAKRAAGPLDDEIFKFLSLAKKNRWVTLDAKQGQLKPVRPGPEAGKASEHAAKMLGSTKSMVDDMLDQMKRWSYQTLERWATVLEAVQVIADAGQHINVETVKDVIRTHADWVPKLNRQEFSDANIEATLRGLCKLGFVVNHS